MYAPTGTASTHLSAHPIVDLSVLDTGSGGSVVLVSLCINRVCNVTEGLVVVVDPGHDSRTCVSSVDFHFR